MPENALTTPPLSGSLGALGLSPIVRLDAMSLLLSDGQFTFAQLAHARLAALAGQRHVEYVAPKRTAGGPKFAMRILDSAAARRMQAAEQGR